MTHRPKNPYCRSCDRAKMTRRRCFSKAKKGGDKNPGGKKTPRFKTTEATARATTDWKVAFSEMEASIDEVRSGLVNTFTLDETINGEKPYKGHLENLYARSFIFMAMLSENGSTLKKIRTKAELNKEDLDLCKRQDVRDFVSQVKDFHNYMDQINEMITLAELKAMLSQFNNINTKEEFTSLGKRMSLAKKSINKCIKQTKGASEQVTKEAKTHGKRIASAAEASAKAQAKQTKGDNGGAAPKSAPKMRARIHPAGTGGIISKTSE